MTKRQSIALIILGLTGIAGCRPAEKSAEEAKSVEPPPVAQPPAVTPPVETTVFGRNASFTINGKKITLVDGESITPMENSSAKTTTRYLGDEAKGDLNGDGLEDLAFWVTQDAGGSGMFHYVVVALKSGSGYTTTNAFLVGDRIAPQSVQIRGDVHELHVNFGGRKRGEPMTTPPSEAKVLVLKVTANGVLTGAMS